MAFDYLYRCPSTGSVNNGLMIDCAFEHVFLEGEHHCPQCGHRLVRVPTGPSVSDLLRKGALEERRKKDG